MSPGSASILPSSVKKRMRPLLRHDQQLAVGVVEIVALHRLGDEIDVRGHAGLGVDVARRGHGAHAREEGELLLGDRHRAPAQLPDRAVVLAKAGAVFQWGSAVFLKRGVCFTDGRMR